MTDKDRGRLSEDDSNENSGSEVDEQVSGSDPEESENDD